MMARDRGDSTKRRTSSSSSNLLKSVHRNFAATCDFVLPSMKLIFYPTGWWKSSPHRTFSYWPINPLYQSGCIYCVAYSSRVLSVYTFLILHFSFERVWITKVWNPIYFPRSASMRRASSEVFRLKIRVLYLVLLLFFFLTYTNTTWDPSSVKGFFFVSFQVSGRDLRVWRKRIVKRMKMYIRLEFSFFSLVVISDSLLTYDVFSDRSCRLLNNGSEQRNSSQRSPYKYEFI